MSVERPVALHSSISQPLTFPQETAAEEAAEVFTAEENAKTSGVSGLTKRKTRALGRFSGLGQTT